MKKLLSVLLAVAMLLTCVSGAFAENAEKPVVTVTVSDADGAPIVGAEVIVYVAGTRNIAAAFISDGNPIVLDNLEELTYSVRATDTRDGYSDSATFYYDMDQDIDLVIRKLQTGTKVTVGSVTKTTGEFATDLWSNNTADIDVRAMLHGYSTVAWDSNLQYTPNYTIMTDLLVENQKNGDKTYTFVLKDNLTYNNGQPLTAADFVFSVLLQSNAAIGELGANTMAYASIVGQADYLSGARREFTGVRLISDTRFSLTISKDSLPYFYEMTYVNVMPYPMSIIAPDCTLVDNGNGAYITGPFTAELLASTMRGENGYCAKPMVTTGAYQLVSYDAATGTVEMKVNPRYIGNYEGHKPVIEKVTLKLADYDTALADLESGKLSILNKMSREDITAAGTEKARVQLDAAGNVIAEPAFSVANYMRTGYGCVALACEDAVTSSTNVRLAMAYALDKAQFITDYLGENGLEVYSYYGLGQWMAQPYASTMQDEVTVYPYDLTAAETLLADDGWTLNAEGKDFVAGTDAVRYKKVDGQLIPLEIRFAQTKDNKASQWLVDNYAAALTSIGFSFTAEEMPFTDVLAQYYRDTERTSNAMFMASNFNIVFDPYYSFNKADAYQGVMNTSGIMDDELEAIALELRQYAPDDLEGYTACWLRLMQRYAEILPTIPVYSNVYFDFYESRIQEYAPNAQWSWPAAIMYSWIAE